MQRWLNPLRSERLVLLCGAALCALACGCGSMAVVLKSEPTVSPKLSDVRRLAVVGLTSNSRLVDAKYLDSTVTGQVIALNYYQMVERAQVDKLLQEHGFQMSAMVDENTAREAGKILAVDAVIFGHIGAADVRTERGSQMVTRLLANGQSARELKPTAVKKGVASISMKLVKIETGEIVASVSKTEEITEPPLGAAIGEAEIAGLGSDDAIAREIVEKQCGEFVDQISPFIATGTRYIHKGKGPDMQRAYLYASRGLWDKAMETWAKVAKQDPENAAVCNNLGVAQEKAGDRQQAGMWYDKAVTLDPIESDFAKNYTEFKGGLKPQRVERKKKFSSRRFTQGLRGLFRMGTTLYQQQRHTTQPQPQPQQPVGAQYRCPSCGNVFAGPPPNAPTRCPACHKQLYTHRCRCGMCFAAPAAAWRVRCPGCQGIVHRQRR